MHKMDEEDSYEYENNDDTIIRKVSQAPLHVFRPLSSGLNRIEERKLVELLKEKDLFVKRGPFTQEEDNRLIKNWKRFAKDFPEINSYPSVAFGLSKLPEKIKSQAVSSSIKRRWLKRECRRRKLLLRMSYKLDDRLCSDIYKRCRFLFVQKTAFSKTSINEIDADEMEKIKELYEIYGNNWQFIARKMDVQSETVRLLVRKLNQSKIERDQRSQRWTEEEDLILRGIVADVVGTNNVDSLSCKDMPWNEIWEQIEQSGSLSRSVQACYGRWMRTHKDIEKRKRLLNEVSITEEGEEESDKV